MRCPAFTWISDTMPSTGAVMVVSILDTPTYFFGMKPGEEVRVDIDEGKMLLVKLDNITKPDGEGNREIQFELDRKSVV